MRLAEIALVALPLVVFLTWRIMVPTGEPPKALAIGMVIVTVAMGVTLLVLWYEDAAPPTAGYVPARQEAGHILPPRIDPAPR